MTVGTRIEPGDWLSTTLARLRSPEGLDATLPGPLLHAELRPYGIRVCAVVAGGMRTPFLLDRFPDLDQTKLQDPENVAETIKHVLLQPAGTAIAEVMVLPTQESSWP